MKASELIQILQRRIDTKGDEPIYIYDEYQECYTPFTENHINEFSHGIAIECDEEDDCEDERE